MIKFLEVKRAYYADPENVVVESNAGTNEWAAADPEYHGWRDDWQWRIRPRTIRIGEIDVPEPVRIDDVVAGDLLYAADIVGDSKVIDFVFIPLDPFRERLVSRGICHRSRHNAEQHTDALIIVSGGKV